MSTFRSIDKGKQRASFNDSTLILPIVSLANVSQLASDLVLHSLHMQLVGRLTSKYHIPVISPRDYVEGQEQQPGLTTPVEGRLPFKPDIYSLEILMKKSVFQNSDASFTLIQQRSPVVKSQKDDFVKALVTFVKEEGLARILLVAGVDAGMRQAQDFDNPSPFRYLTTPNAKLSGSLKEVMTPFDPASPDLQANHLPLMPSSGITRRLLAALMEDSPATEVSAVMMYVAEGDNRFDAHVLARAIAKVLSVDISEDQWREPVSWKLGLYGQDKLRSTTEGSAELYG